MLNRRREGAEMSDPVLREAGFEILAEAYPDQPSRTWDLLRTALDDGFRSTDQRLKALGPLRPDRFSRLRRDHARLTCAINAGPVESRYLGNVRNGADIQIKVKRGWAPTEPAFRRFLDWLDEGHDSKGERYLEMRQRLVRYFDHKQCVAADDLADETLNRVMRRLEEEGTITDATPAHYCYIVAKFVFLEHLRVVRPEVNSDDSDFDSVAIAAGSNPPPDQTAQKMLDCLDVCLQKLAAGERDLILEYYRGEQGEKIQRRRELAEKLELSTNALSIRACRIRDRLEQCVGRCSAGS